MIPSREGLLSLQIYSRVSVLTTGCLIVIQACGRELWKGCLQERRVNSIMESYGTEESHQHSIFSGQIDENHFKVKITKCIKGWSFFSLPKENLTGFSKCRQQLLFINNHVTSSQS